MSYRLNTRSGWMLPLLLATMFLPAGCQSILPTRTGATDWGRLAEALGNQTAAAQANDANRADLCKRGWLPQTYSSRDTEQTQAEARANNAARAAFCEAVP